MFCKLSFKRYNPATEVAWLTDISRKHGVTEWGVLSPEVEMGSDDSIFSTLEYAERKVKPNLWIDWAIGAVAIFIIFPLTGYIAFYASWTSASSVPMRLFWIAAALAGFGFGVRCVHCAIIAWRRRNIIESSTSLPPESVRWRWMAPAGWFAVCLFRCTDTATSSAQRIFWIVLGLLSAVLFIKQLYVHVRVWRGKEACDFTTRL